jgi:hypothetical protein
MRKQKKKLASQDAALVPLNRPCLPLSEKPDHHLTRNEPFSQEMHLKIPLSSQGLKMAYSNPGCRISVLSLLCEIDTTDGFLTSSSFRSVLFRFIFLDYSPFHCWKAKPDLRLSRTQIKERIPQMERITGGPRITCATPPFPEVVWQYSGAVVWWCGNTCAKGCSVATHRTFSQEVHIAPHHLREHSSEKTEWCGVSIDS